jgi:hypothetical protein
MHFCILGLPMHAYSDSHVLDMFCYNSMTANDGSVDYCVASSRRPSQVRAAG